MEKKNVTEVVTLTVSYTDWADMRAASTCSRSPGI